MDRKTRNLNFNGKMETSWLSKEGELEAKSLLAYITLSKVNRYQSLSEIGYMVGLLACQYIVVPLSVNHSKNKSGHGAKEER
jgi:hypothetical protein